MYKNENFTSYSLNSNNQVIVITYLLTYLPRGKKQDKQRVKKKKYRTKKEKIKSLL